MAISDELSDEERAIMIFLKRYFESGMPNALWILKESENVSDVRAILEGYREFYKGHGTH